MDVLSGNKPGYMVRYGLPQGGITRYYDTGCRLAPRCLECPFPKCSDTSTRTKRHGIAHTLTLRQAQVAQLVAEGLSNKEVADALSISIHTTRNHVASAMKAFGFKNRAQLAVQYVKEGATG